MYTVRGVSIHHVPVRSLCPGAACSPLCQPSSPSLLTLPRATAALVCSQQGHAGCLKPGGTLTLTTFLSLSLSERCIPVVVFVLPLSRGCSIHGMDAAVFVYPLLMNWGCFQAPALVDDIAVDACEQVLVWTDVSIPLR